MKATKLGVDTVNMRASKMKDSYKEGAIKGNTVTNAIALATARGNTSPDVLKECAKDVLELHAFVEALDVLGYIERCADQSENTSPIEELHQKNPTAAK